MTELKQQLRSDLTAAMKARDEVRTRTLRMALTAVTHEEVAGKTVRDLTDADVLRLLTREAKRRREADKQYATWTGLDLLARQIDELEKRLADARQSGQCLLSLGWGGGLLGKSAWLDTSDPTYSQILQQGSLYGKATGSHLPVPKHAGTTR